MRKIAIYIPIIIAVFASCDTRFFEDVPSDRMFHDWGVVNDTRIFGQKDSLYYLINPVKNVSDSLYYNADYTDSYFSSDSTRIVMQYIPHDSIIFNMDRLYAVESNPKEITANVRLLEDTVPGDVCLLKLKRGGAYDKKYYMPVDSTFVKLLRKEKPLEIYMSNTKDGMPDANSQNYKYILYTSGFSEAIELCEKLNQPKTDTVKNMKLDTGSQDLKGDSHLHLHK